MIFPKCVRALGLLFLVISLFAIPSKAQLQKSDLRFRANPTLTVPISPSPYSDSYKIGRGLNVGLGVFITPVWDLQVDFEYTAHSFKGGRSPDESTILRPDLPLIVDSDPTTPFPEATGDYSGGTLTRTRLGAGLKYTVSETTDFDTYLRLLGSVSRYNRRAFSVSGNAIDGPGLFEDTSVLAQGFDAGLGFEIPAGMTASLIIEGSYSVHYPFDTAAETLQSVEVRVGFLLNGN